jgi:hypothetical protein
MQQDGVMVSSPSRLKEMLKQVLQGLAHAGIPHALTGGMAMAVHGAVRATKDVDFLVNGADRDRIDAVMRQLGFAAEADGEGFARYVRRPLQELPEVVEWVDLLFATRPIGLELIEHALATPLRWEGIALPTVSPAGVVLMKVIAIAADKRRPYDEGDVRFLLREHGDTINHDWLRREAAEIGDDVAQVMDQLLRDEDPSK